MSKRNQIIIGVIIVVIIIGAVWYGVSRKSTEEGPVKIGVILPLSGKIANWGDSAKGGIDVAVEEINKAGGIDGKKVEIVYEDDQCDKTKATTAVQKLINIDNIKVIIGPLCSGSVLAAAPVAENAKVIMLGFGSTAAISSAGDYIFRHTYSDAYQGVFLANQIKDVLDINKIGIVYVNNDYGKGLFDGFNDEFTKLGGYISNVESYNLDVTDFRTIIAKIKNSQPEAVLLISYGGKGGLIVKQAKELGVNLQIFASDNFGSEDVIKSGGDSVENVIFSSSIPLNEEDLMVQDFKNKYFALNGNNPSILFVAASGYDAAKIIFDTVGSVGYNSDAIKNYFYGLKDYNGISGKISFDENGDATKDFMFQTIKNGQFVPYEQ